MWHGDRRPETITRAMTRRPAMRPSCGAWPTRLRGSMDAAEYKHVVLGLIFLKYVSDAFEETPYGRARRVSRTRKPTPKTRMSTRAESIFWVPPEARWALSAGARPGSPPLASLVDSCDDRHRARQPGSRRTCCQRTTPGLPSTSSRLGQVVDLVSNIKVGGAAGGSHRRAGRASTSTSSSQFALRRGPQGRRVLHAALRG